MRARFVSVVSFGFVLVACAAEQKTSSTPSSGAPPGDNQNHKVEMAPQSPDSSVRDGRTTDRVGVDQAKLESALEARDCALACKALASLLRSTDDLCKLGEPTDCADARSRADRAKDRVTKACGTCPE